ncbi:hypothetical protein J6Q66_03300 [bacterium]|nr:hypothetical protein [bacterium]
MKEEYSKNYRRWYDKDPILSKSMAILEQSSDEDQIKIALNLIKVIAEHQLADSEFEDVSDILENIEDGIEPRGTDRWYDLNSTVQTAITMLENCPSTTQSVIAKEMARLVVEKIKSNNDDIGED